jgi:spermidine/putrescine transport system substrate-binding protein
MTSLIRFVITALALVSIKTAFAADNVVNVYTWAEEIPHAVIDQFEKETGIQVNYSTFDSNEVMFSKLRAAKNAGYDIVEPSSYYVDRMRRQNILEKLDKSKLSNFKNIDPFFLNPPYDPQSEYSIPLVWGITGVFLNKNYFSSQDVSKWASFLDSKYSNQLMFLDDAREVFSMAMRMLNYSINDNNPEHIRQAYLRLKELMPNVRLFNSDAVISLLIDEDAAIGMAWNGDLYKAQRENNQLEFVFPKDGFEIWVDNLVMLKNSPHRENAYKFLNFLMRPEIAKEISMTINYSTANLAARKLMPLEIRNNPTLYPSVEVLKRGEFQSDIGEKTLALYEKYWEQLKMGG